MKIILDDGSTFEINEDTTSLVLIDKFVRIMKYMTFSDVTIANGLLNALNEMLHDKEIEKLIKNFCECVEAYDYQS